MNGIAARSITTPLGGRAVALGVVLLILLTGCSGGPDPQGAAPASSPAQARESVVAAEPLREARKGWKMFADPNRLLSFELPAAWVVQPVKVESGEYSPNSLHYAVRTADGDLVAELHTGIIRKFPDCAQEKSVPYTVIASSPTELVTAADSTNTIEPRFVVRLMQGFTFFSSYGITDQVGGADGRACVLTNTVQGPEKVGRFSFGDAEAVAPKSPADTGPGTLTFPTIAKAEKHFDSQQFRTVQQMIRSLRLSGQQ